MQKEPLAVVPAVCFQGDRQTRICSGPGRHSRGLKVQTVSWTPAPSMDMLLFVPHVQHALSLMVSIVVHGVYSGKVGRERK